MRSPFCLKASAILLAATPASAHDFWIEPASWNASSRHSMELSLQVGHGKDRQRSPIRASRLTRFDAVHADGSTTSLLPDLHLGGPTGDATAGFSPSPAALVVLVTDATARTYLDAARFNTHVDEEGLVEAEAWRRQNRATGAGGSENYGRIAKSLLPATGAAQIAARPLGLELEIVPLVSPYAKGTLRLPVQVLWRGTPLRSATVKLYELADDGAPRQRCITTGDGICAFDFRPVGSWLINVIWSVPNAADEPTEFRTIFSSLSFGFAKSPTDWRQTHE